MNTSNRIAPSLLAGNFSPPVHRKSITAWLTAGLLLLTMCAARATDVPDDDYLAIYGIMTQADALGARGETNAAHAKYIEAERDLEQFQRSNPNWNVHIVTFRLNYLAGKIAGTTPAPATATPAIATNTSTVTLTAAAKTASKSPVTLLDAGSEPRTVLRLHPTAGDKQSVTMTMKVGMDMGAAAPAPTMDIPAVVMSMDVEVKNISPDGDISYTMAFNDATIAADTNTTAAIAAAMKSSLAGISGMTGTGEMSNCGLVKKVEMKLPATAAPQLQQTIGQMKNSLNNSATPLPEEAVGPGARWKYQTRIKSQGMSIDQTVICQLVSVEGDRITLRNTLTQNAAHQIIQNPAMPGLKMDLTKLTGAGAGTATLDLGKLMPVAATLAEKTRIVMSMNVGQQPHTMDMKMNINVAIESK